jgi:hypothetical protein
VLLSAIGQLKENDQGGGSPLVVCPRYCNSCTAPHLVADVPLHGLAQRGGRRDVAAQVAFESKRTLKPGFHFIGSRVETRRLSSHGSPLNSRLVTAPP